MILLSSLLGPVKPPVASEQDLHSAGGLYRLVEYAGSLVAESADGAGTIPIPDGDRCLICLSDYEAAEELRQLTKCKHVFHRDCIDQVRSSLMTLYVREVWLTLLVVDYGPKFLPSLQRPGCSRDFKFESRSNVERTEQRHCSLTTCMALNSHGINSLASLVTFIQCLYWL